MKCNYEYLLEWIKTNPKVRSIGRFSKDMGFSVQRIHYHIKNETFMSNEIIEKAQATYNLTAKQVNKFFYSCKLLN